MTFVGRNLHVAWLLRSWESCLLKSLSNLVKASTIMTEWKFLVGFCRLDKDELQNEEPQSSFSNVNLEDFSKFLCWKRKLNKPVFKFKVLYSKDFVSAQVLCYQNDRKAWKCHSLKNYSISCLRIIKAYGLWKNMKSHRT